MAPRDYRGSTILITGASSGIGQEFARRLAERGTDLVVVARRSDRLRALRDELVLKHKVTVTPLDADLGAPDAANRLAERVDAAGIRVDGLINSAGFGTRARFEDRDATRLHEEVTLNVTALVETTRAFYPTLRESSRGLLLNLASTAALQPVPEMAVYAATKAFVLNFTEALWVENRGTNLAVLALCPGLTETEFEKVAGNTPHFGPSRSVQQVVQTALRTLDRRNPPPSVIDGGVNRLLAVSERFVPRRALAVMAASAAK